MPAQKPHRSKQDYATPKEFIEAVERDFGNIAWDLAAHVGNTVCDNYCYFGPDHPSEHFRDAFACEWSATIRQGLLWLNPPFGSIAPWAAKCAYESRRGANILLLVPASVGSNWFWDHVAPYAHVYAVSPRLSFDGKHPFPKDLILAEYRPPERVVMGPMVSSTAFSRYRWREISNATQSQKDLAA
jgi:DNA N-6-adenine-methyltransferase Dam